MAKFHRLKISEITRETADCVSVVFDVPADLKSEFQYIQGQYLTLKIFVKGEELRRSYSVCSSPVADNELRVAIKKVQGGRGSTYINEVAKPGDTMEVMTPMGGFYSPVNASNAKHYVLFAGGSGITPMLSILKTVLASEPNSRITLFYGNRDQSSVIFRKQLDDLVTANSSRLSVHHILEQGAADEMHSGQLSQDKINAFVKQYVDLKGDNEYFICGPGPMMENAKAVLEQVGAAKDRVHIEYFTAVIEATAPKSGEGDTIVSQVTIIMDGDEKVVELSSDGMPVLDAALAAGLDAPFACKGAVCCTCRAKVMEGKMSMDNNFALTDQEVEEGYVLTCQAHPLTEKVVVDYDQP